jgi:hypothetical protein
VNFYVTKMSLIYYSSSSFTDIEIEFQESDYTTALKSCISENDAFIHIDEDLYYRISPRYPFVFVNDYLQDIPVAKFHVRRGVDAIDSSIFGMFLFAACVGFIATIYQIKLWELLFQSFKKCCQPYQRFFRTSDADSVCQSVQCFKGKEDAFRPAFPIDRPTRVSKILGSFFGRRYHSYSIVSQVDENDNEQKTDIFGD